MKTAASGKLGTCTSNPELNATLAPSHGTGPPENSFCYSLVRLHMHLTPKQRRRRVFLHWETWLGLLLAGLLAVLGSYVGQVFPGHSSLCVAIGGAIGGGAFHLVTGYVSRRYYPPSA
jgi:hypothetical protein